MSLGSTPFNTNVHLFPRPQISVLIAKKAPIKVSSKYLDLIDVFSPDLMSELPEHTKINDYAIELVDSQQLPYGPIYSLRSVELETIKA